MCKIQTSTSVVEFIQFCASQYKALIPEILTSSPLEKLIVAQLFKRFPSVMEPNGSCHVH
jgi:hypothetical protein